MNKLTIIQLSTSICIPSSAPSKYEAIFSGQHLLESFKTAKLYICQKDDEIYTHSKHLKMLQKLKQTSLKLQGELRRM